MPRDCAWSGVEDGTGGGIETKVLDERVEGLLRARLRRLRWPRVAAGIEGKPTREEDDWLVASGGAAVDRREWVDVEDYIRAIRICAKIVVDWSS
jgi:hypothetical protein